MRPNPRLIPRLNVEFNLDDFRRALQGNDNGSGGLETRLQALWPGSQALFLDSGRTALYVALKALDLGPDANIGVPLFTCDAVFLAIQKAGYRPIFLDIDGETYTLDPLDVQRKSKFLDAIIAIHTFGHPAQLDDVAKAANHVPLIEDCAHAVGSRFKGEIVGKTGEFSFFSFRPGKPLSTGSLGMLLVRDAGLYDHAREIVAEFPQFSGAEHAMSCLLGLARSSLYRRPWFGMFALPVGFEMDATLDLMDKRSFAPHRPSDGSISVLERRIDELESRVDRRREIAHRFSEALALSSVLGPHESNWARHSYYQFAIRFSTEHSRDDASLYLAEHGVDSIKFYDGIPAAAEAYGYIHDCPNSEIAAKTVLSIPCYETLSDADVRQIEAALASLGESS